MNVEKDRLVSELKKIPPLSATLQNTLSLLNEKNSNWNAIYNSIVRDPVLTGRVLQIANSPFYGCYRKISSLQDACVILGAETLQGLIYNLIILSRFRNNPNTPKIDYDSLWKSCFRLACLTKSISEKCNSYPAASFTASLFCYIDLIIQDLYFPLDLDERLLKLNIQNDVFSVSDTSHWWLTHTLLEMWNFPQVITSVFNVLEQNTIREIIMNSAIVIKSVDDSYEAFQEAIDIAEQNLQKIGLPSVDLNKCYSESESMFQNAHILLGSN